MNQKQILDMLRQLNISYNIIEHPPANTIEDIDGFEMPNGNEIVKNLFLRDDKKRNYYLLVIQKDKTVNLKQLCVLLNSRPLSFASENDLFNYLGLKKGAVTPLGVLNDIDRKVKVIFDENLFLFHSLGIHPNENTATLWLSLNDLLNIIKIHGNAVSFLKFGKKRHNYEFNWRFYSRTRLLGSLGLSLDRAKPLTLECSQVSSTSKEHIPHFPFLTHSPYCRSTANCNFSPLMFTSV